MRTRIALWGAVALSSAASLAFAQAPTTAPASDDDRLNQLEQRLTELENAVRTRDEEIARLKAQSDEGRAAHGAAGTGAAATTSTSTADEIERTKQDVLRDIESRSESPLTLRNPPASFNPDIAVIIDALGTWSNDRSNDAYNRFDVREAELDLRAAIDPRADGVLVLAFERDVENPVFPEAGEEEEGGVESSANIEEGYAFFHDFGVKNLTAKLGRFHVRFGRQNMLHLHDLPTSDPALVNQAFLSPESLTDAGLSLSYVIPSQYVADQYIEVVAEVLSGEGASSESPTLGDDIEVDSPIYNLHALWNRDVARDLNLELGASWLTAQNNAAVSLYGLDVTLIRTDPTGQFNNQLIQAELIYGDVEGVEAWGAYVLGQQQLHKDWYVGLRLDWTENPADAAQEAWAVSPYVSWYWSEFLRFRLEYQHRDGDIDAADVVYLQATYIFGAHPPHPYWSMR